MNDKTKVPATDDLFKQLVTKSAYKMGNWFFYWKQVCVYTKLYVDGCDTCFNTVNISHSNYVTTLVIILHAHTWGTWDT